jgi:hypothetical protein
LAADSGGTKVESFEQEWNDVAPVRQSCFNLTAQPIAGVMAALECGRREQYEEVGAGFYVFRDDTLQVTACQSVEIEENIIAVLGEVLEDGERPERIGAAVAEEDCFFNTFHNQLE